MYDFLRNGISKVMMHNENTEDNTPTIPPNLKQLQRRRNALIVLDQKSGKTLLDIENDEQCRRDEVQPFSPKTRRFMMRRTMTSEWSSTDSTKEEGSFKTLQSPLLLTSLTEGDYLYNE
jgi:hypothetical protein